MSFDGPRGTTSERDRPWVCLPATTDLSTRGPRSNGSGRVGETEVAPQSEALPTTPEVGHQPDRKVRVSLQWGVGRTQRAGTAREGLPDCSGNETETVGG